MNMDEGSWADSGQRALAYRPGFSMANGKAPSFTWYQFVTLRKGAADIDYKCRGDLVGTVNGTSTSNAPPLRRLKVDGEAHGSQNCGSSRWLHHKLCDGGGVLKLASPHHHTNAEGLGC